MPEALGQVIALNPPRPSPLADRSDDELMLLCAAGHRAAFEVLLDRHLPALSRFCAKFTGSAEAGEDLAQDVLVELWTRCASYRPQGQFRAYLLRMARSRCLNHQRGQRRRETASAKIEAESVSEGSTVEALLEAERTRRLQDAMAQLPVKLREALLLRFDQGLDYREIARITRTFESTARSRVFHGLRKLNLLLGEEQS